MNKKIIIYAGSGLAVFVIVGGILGFVITRPKAHYNKGVELYKSQQYALAADEFKAAGDYKNAQENMTAALKHQALIEGDTAMQEGNYALACEKYTAAGDLDQDGAKLLEATKNNVYQMGVNHLESKEYLAAAECFNDNRFRFEDREDKLVSCAEGLLDEGKYTDVQTILTGATKISVLYKYLQYSDGMVALDESDYSLAKKKFEGAGSIRDAEDMLEKSTYLVGVEAFDKGRYVDAYNNFVLVSKDYEDNAEYLEKSRFMNAELLFNSGDYVAAKEIFSEYADDYEYDGVVVSERLATIDEYSDYFEMSEAWKCCYGNIEAKEVTGGAWTSWYLPDDKIKANRSEYATAELYFTVKPDGEVLLQGTIEIAYIDEYHYVKQLLELDKKSYTIYDSVTSSSGTIQLDDNTTLKYSKDSLELKYEKTEQITAYTKDVCSANYKFDHYNFG